MTHATGGGARRLRPPRVARFLAVLHGFLPCCAMSCRVASHLAALRGFLPCCVAGCLFVWSGAGAVLQGERTLPRCGTGASCRRVKLRPPLRAPSPHHVKLRPPLRAHNTTIQANFGTQGRCRFHLLEPQGTQGRCWFHLLEPQGTQGRYRFRTFPRVPSYGCVPANLPWSRRHAASCRSALLGRGTTVAPLTCSRQPRPTGFRHLRGQEPHRHGPDRRARRGVQRRIG